MEIAKIIEKILKNSDYAGEYTYNDMLEFISDNHLSSLIMSDKNGTKLLLISDKGEIKGALQVDNLGILFGDKALYKLDKSLNFRIFVIDEKLASAVISRCRIYKISLHKENLAENTIPQMGSFGIKPSKVAILITLDGKPVEGAKVIMKRKEKAANSYVTTSSGRVEFVTPSGDYKCTVILKEHPDFNTDIKISGSEDSFTIRL